SCCQENVRARCVPGGVRTPSNGVRHERAAGMSPRLQRAAATFPLGLAHARGIRCLPGHTEFAAEQGPLSLTRGFAPSPVASTIETQFTEPGTRASAG